MREEKDSNGWKVNWRLFIHLIFGTSSGGIIAYIFLPDLSFEQKSFTIIAGLNIILFSSIFLNLNKKPHINQDYTFQRILIALGATSTISFVVESFLLIFASLSDGIGSGVTNIVSTYNSDGIKITYAYGLSVSVIYYTLIQKSD